MDLYGKLMRQKCLSDNRFQSFENVAIMLILVYEANQAYDGHLLCCANNQEEELCSFRYHIYTDLLSESTIYREK